MFDGHWVELPTADISVLVAFVAGPGRASGEPIRAGTALASERGTGLAHRPRSILTAEDLEEALTDTTAYLGELDVPPPPAFMRWSVLVPQDVSRHEFLARIEEAASPVEVLDDPVTDARESARAVARVTAQVLGVPNPLA